MPTNLWTNGASNADWDTNGNWSLGRKPITGDDVSILTANCGGTGPNAPAGNITLGTITCDSSGFICCWAQVTASALVGVGLMNGGTVTSITAQANASDDVTNRALRVYQGTIGASALVKSSASLFIFGQNDGVTLDGTAFRVENGGNLSIASDADFNGAVFTNGSPTIQLLGPTARVGQSGINLPVAGGRSAVLNPVSIGL